MPGNIIIHIIIIIIIISVIILINQQGRCPQTAFFLHLHSKLQLTAQFKSSIEVLHLQLKEDFPAPHPSCNLIKNYRNWSPFKR